MMAKRCDVGARNAGCSRARGILTDNPRWILKRRPTDGDRDAGRNLDLVSEPLMPMRDGEILVRNLFLSLDPTNRLWMSEREQSLPPVAVGDVMRGVTLGVV